MEHNSLITVEFIKNFKPCKEGIENFENKYPKFNNKLININRFIGKLKLYRS